MKISAASSHSKRIKRVFTKEPHGKIPLSKNLDWKFISSSFLILEFPRDHWSGPSSIIPKFYGKTKIEFDLKTTYQG